MNLPPLPELPQPAVLTGRNSVLYVGGLPSCTHTAFTAEQVREFALSYGRAVQEACAATCEVVGAGYDNEWNRKLGVANDLLDVAEDCAAAIRNGVLREGEGNATDHASDAD